MVLGLSFLQGLGVYWKALKQGECLNTANCKSRKQLKHDPKPET